MRTTTQSKSKPLVTGAAADGDLRGRAAPQVGLHRAVRVERLHDQADDVVVVAAKRVADVAQPEARAVHEEGRERRRRREQHALAVDVEQQQQGGL